MSRAPRNSQLPARVTESSRMNLMTPQGKDRLTFGKLNSAKTMSATTERKISFFGKRSSGAGGSRSSLFGAFSTMEKIKDPRPLHDKTFVQQCIKNLCEFLNDSGFPGSVTVKSLQSPSTKEFLKIFCFIYNQLDPNFQEPTSKIEEEIPRLLKELGYPFPLSKSSMYSVGAPHTWPQVLGSLIWMIDSVQVMKSVKGQDLLYPDFSDGDFETEDGIQFNKLFMEYTSRCYEEFMQGADTFERQDAIFLPKLKELFNVDENHLACLAEKAQVLVREVENLEKTTQMDRLLEERSKKNILQADLQKFQNYRASLETFRASLESKNKALCDELAGTGLRLEAVKQENERLQHILENQKLSPADIERINHERRELQQTISDLTKSLEEAEGQKWKEEINLAKAKESVESVLADYHSLARKLKLIPSSAENACGQDFEIKFTPESAFSQMNNYKIQIEIPLKTMISQMEEETSKQLHHKLSLEEAVDQMNSVLLDKEAEIKQLNQQLQKMSEQVEQDTEEMKRKEESWALEVQSLEDRKSALEKKMMEDMEKVSEELKAAQQQYHFVVQEKTEERRRVVSNLNVILEMVTNYLSKMEHTLAKHKEQVDRDHQECVADESVQKLSEMFQSARDLFD
ncbi:kinetochore protein NDC80 homolog isoform X2 [Erpetoichthys calabaricus]|uniref:Kinetochore protein NDC80 n=2 Tax=Erpetoichthys calabaricus TaxID=27687 RepID=A0A8C4TGG6_ERPCA|nr:kinetochore protein NDC80 homolog isoform X2 [Erpetoichthys calabaricus]XP_028664684.1 kinetochore protein NDC80 homolog isoform X2 [Erpetoichthys calabaricus]